MPLPKLYKREEIEAIAADFLAGLGNGKYDHRTLRIDWVIESLGIEIVPVPGLMEIAEAYLPIEGKRIFVDESQYASHSLRWRFTLAEELAHWLLHKPWFDGKTVEEVQKMQSAFTDKEYLTIEQDEVFGWLSANAWRRFCGSI